MGALAQGMGFGTPAQAAQSSMSWGQASVGLGATGDLLSGIGQAQSYGYAAQVANNNATIMAKNIAATQDAGRYEESVSKLKYGQLESEQKAAQAANGVDVNVGSTKAVRDSTATVGAMDAAMIHYNAAREAWGQENQWAALKAQAGADRAAQVNSVFGGAMKAGATLLGGASSLGQKYAQWKYLSEPAS